MHQCCVFGCRNAGNFSFPKETKTRKLWEAATRCKDFRAKKHSKICSAHFKSEDFIKVGKYSGLTNTRRILKRGIVPSVFAWTITEDIKSAQRRERASAREAKRKLCFSHIEKCDDLFLTPRVTTATCSSSIEVTTLDFGVDCVEEIVVEENSEYNPENVQSDIVSVRDCATQKNYQFYTIESFRNDDEDKSDNDAALQPKESQLKKCVLCDKCEDSTDPSTTLTKFPTDIKICRAWVKFVGIRSLAEKTSDKLHETTYLCLKHFAPGSYDKGVVRPQRIPTKNLPYLPLGEGVLEPNFGAINAPNKCAKVDKQQYESDKSEAEDCYEAEIDDELVEKDKTTDADGIHTLFISYASTFRRLSTKLQIMLRLDLAKLFARYEIKNTEFIEARKIEKEKLIQEKRKERLKLFQNTVMTKSKGPPKTFSRKKKNFTVTNTSSQTDACEKAVDPMLCSLKSKDSTQLNSAVDPVAAVSTSSSTKVSSSGPMLTVMPLASTQKQIPKFSIGVTEAATTPDDSIISNKTTLTPIQFSDKKFKVVKVVKPSQIRSQISAKILTQVNKDIVSQVPASINSLLKRKVANLSGTPMSLLKPVKILRSQIVPPKDPLHISDNEAEDDSCVKFDGSTVDSVVKTEELDEDIS